ncbi:MAG: RecX family transcriptional regulator [Clostridiales Family XIII bacterium]|nr:RecX family transcriptional regulator [Clostridiales Family XIII bacterium]
MPGVSAFDRAVDMLARRMRTEREMRGLLSGKTRGRVSGGREVVGYDESEIDDAIERLKEFGYIDDRAYAERYRETRVEKKRGHRRIKEEMLRRGLSAEIVEETLAGGYVEEVERANAAAVAAKALEALPEDMDPRRKARKISSRLVAQGYGYEVINPVIEDLIFRGENG